MSMGNAPAGIPALGVSTIGIMVLWVKAIVKLGSAEAGTTRLRRGTRAFVPAAKKRFAPCPGNGQKIVEQKQSQSVPGLGLQKPSTKIFVDSYEGLRIWFVHED